jgi:hypothetical protein
MKPDEGVSVSHTGETLLIFQDHGLDCSVVSTPTEHVLPVHTEPNSKTKQNKTPPTLSFLSVFFWAGEYRDKGYF